MRNSVCWVWKSIKIPKISKHKKNWIVSRQKCWIGDCICLSKTSKGQSIYSRRSSSQLIPWFCRRWRSSLSCSCIILECYWNSKSQISKIYLQVDTTQILKSVGESQYAKPKTKLGLVYWHFTWNSSARLSPNQWQTKSN